MSKIVNEERARQGRKGSKVLIILVSALILAAIAWFIAENYGQAISNQPTQLETSTS